MCILYNICISCKLVCMYVCMYMCMHVYAHNYVTGFAKSGLIRAIINTEKSRFKY